jgi:hypothetical protein
MIDGRITNNWAVGVWLGLGIVMALWYGSRRRVVSRRLRGHGENCPQDQRDWLRTRLVLEAFVASGAWLLAFGVLDWLS